MAIRKTKITVENRHDMVEARYRKARAAAAGGVLKAAPPSLNLKTEYDAYAYMIGRQFLLACDPDQGRSSTEAAKFVTRVLDLLPDSSDKGASTTNNLQINVSEGQLTALIERLGAIREQNGRKRAKMTAKLALLT
jgi:hypothetical protein